MNEWEEGRVIHIERLLCARLRAVLGFPPVIAAAPSAARRLYRLPWHREHFGNHSLSEFGKLAGCLWHR